MNKFDKSAASALSDQYAPSMEVVARELLGDPNKALSTPLEWRYGGRGSLSIDLPSGRWFDHERGHGGGVLDLIRRETGCDKRGAVEWLKARGLIQDDLRDTVRPRIVTTYDYRNETGELLFQVCRMNPKDFRQRRPDGRGGWTWSTKGVRRVPYRLPELLAADPGAVVFVTEGEKDAHRLTNLGLVATTNPGGAGRWPDDFAGYFTGRRVAVLADNDDAGRDHAVTVRDKLRAGGVQAAVLTLPDLPPKGDVSDWLDAGGNDKALASMAEMLLAEATAEVQARQDKLRFELIRADKLEFRDPDWLIKGLVEADSLSLLFGDPGCGKSFLAFDLACCIATGREFHGHEVKRGAVIYICGEGHNGIKRRLRAWEIQNRTSLEGQPLFISRVAAQFLDPASVAAVVESIDTTAADAGQPVALIVIDTLNRNMGSGDESNTKDMTAFVAAVDAARARYGAGVLIIHHTGHNNKERARGSYSLHGALDHEYRMEKDKQTFTLTNTKMKDNAPPAPLSFKLCEMVVGHARDGTPITSAAIELTEAPQRKGMRLSPNQRVALEALAQFVADNGQPNPGGTGWPEVGSVRCVKVEEFLAFLRDKMASDNPDNRRRLAARALKDLLEKGVVQTNAGQVWTLV